MRHKKKKPSFLKWIPVFLFSLVVIILLIIFFPDKNQITVIDGENKTSVSVYKVAEKNILKKAIKSGVSPLDEYDTCVLNTDNNILDIYRGISVNLTDNDSKYSFEMSSYNLSKESIIDECVKRYQISPIQRDDIVSYDSSSNSVKIIRSFDFLFNCADKTERSISYFGETVEEFINRREIDIQENDKLSLSLDTVLTKNSVLTLERRRKLFIKVDGEIIEEILPVSTVEEALKTLNISLSDDDVIDCELSDIVTDNMEIEINRVEYKEITEEEIIDYEIIKKNDSSMNVGQTLVTQYGVEGLKEITKKQKYVDGELVDEEILDEEIISEPVDKIMLVGTKPLPTNKPITTTNEPGTFVDYNGNVVSYLYYHTGKCAAYTGGTHTSIGWPVQKGNVAVDPNLIPYGTKLYIASADGSFVYGYAVAADTGGAVMSGNYLVDCYYDTYAECATLGIRKLNVYVLG